MQSRARQSRARQSKSKARGKLKTNKQKKEQSTAKQSKANTRAGQGKAKQSKARQCKARSRQAQATLLTELSPQYVTNRVHARGKGTVGALHDIGTAKVVEVVIDVELQVNKTWHTSQRSVRACALSVHTACFCVRVLLFLFCFPKRVTVSRCCHGFVL